MKIQKILLAIVIAMTLLCGCTETSDTASTSASTSTSPEIVTVTNPFTDTNGELAVSDGDVTANFGVYINKADAKYLTYENDHLVLPLTIQNENDEMVLGFIVFVDGIVQEYSSDRSDEKLTMQTFIIPERSVSTCELYIDNIVSTEKFDSTSLSFMTIAAPDFVPTVNDPHGKTGDMAVSGTPVPLHMDSSPIVNDIKIQTEYESHAFVDDDISVYKIPIEAEGSITNFVLRDADDEERPVNMIAHHENGRINLKLSAYAVNEAAVKYRISFYKNHDQISFNNDCKYIDMKVKGGFISSADIMLEGINEGDFIYCIAEPIDSFSAIAQKSTTISVFNINDIPAKNDDYKDYMPYIPDPDETVTETEPADEEPAVTLPNRQIVISPDPEDLDDGYYPMYK